MPAPSQRPFCPQLAAPAALQTACGSGLPAATGRHMPSNPAWLHETHAPVQAPAQQTPSAQTFETQSSPATQPAPLAFFTLTPQLPLLQVAGEAQSVPPARQVVRQVGAPVVESQTYGVQSTAFAATQAPRPSHAEAGM